MCRCGCCLILCFTCLCITPLVCHTPLYTTPIPHTLVHHTPLYATPPRTPHPPICHTPSYRVTSDALNDGHHYTPDSIFSYLTRVMYARRTKINPLWNRIIVGGYEDKTPYALLPPPHPPVIVHALEGREKRW